MYGNRGIFHHGDCKGADAAAAYLARKIGYYVVAHPPDIKTYRAFVNSHEEVPQKPYLERNRHIVEASNLILSVPRKMVTLNEILIELQQKLRGIFTKVRDEEEEGL